MSWFHNIFSMVVAWRGQTDSYQLTYYSDSIISFGTGKKRYTRPLKLRNTQRQFWSVK
jgi:hypothetical protein